MPNLSSILNIKLSNCNNIDSGEIALELNKLNIKYGINGTGKSTIARAIQHVVENTNRLNELTPFKNRNKTGEVLLPKVEGLDNINTIKIFDDNYVNQYIFQPNELIKNSFDIFIKTPEYDKLSSEIEVMIVEIANTFQRDDELNTVISTFKSFIDGCGKSSTSLAKNGSMFKGLANGNKIDNIPQELSAYQPYLQNKKDALNLKWLQWQTSGHVYLDIAKTCPFCTTSTAQTRTKIERVAQEFDVKSVDNLIKMLNIFEVLIPFFAEETNQTIRKISLNIDALSDEHKSYLFSVKQQVEDMHSKLEALKYLNPTNLREIDKISDDIKKRKFDWQFFSHLKSPTMEDKITKINASLDKVLVQAGQLQGKINIQKQNIEETIRKYNKEINGFLTCAGYKYSVDLEKTNDNSFRLILKHNDLDTPVTEVKNCLSFGERNAFALVLFMYSALKDEPDLIVLDDPLSSFDDNKQFAILNLLFMGSVCFKNRTVLVLTHEFNFVIDCIYNLKHEIPSSPNATFLSTEKGQLREIKIEKEDIASVMNITRKNITETTNPLCKCVYLRRYLELFCFGQDDKLARQLLSNLFKNRVDPLYITDDSSRPMTEDEIRKASGIISVYIKEFNYCELVELTNNKQEMKNLYSGCNCNYEKLHLYRIINNENSSSRIVKKYVNETFHIENDLLFQLNPRKFDIVPQFIIDECDKDVQELEEQIKGQQNDQA